MPGSDKELLAAAKRGDPKALQDLLLACRHQIRQPLAGKIGRHWQSVLTPDDVMQVTYLEVCLQFSRFESDEPGAFVVWVKKIAENNLRDAIEGLEAGKRPNPRRRVTAAPGSDESFVTLLDLLTATSTTPSRRASGSEARSLLEAAVAKLPENYAQVVRMYDLEERLAKDVAAAMGCSVGAVYMMRSRAHNRLREHLPSASGFFSRFS